MRKRTAMTAAAAAAAAMTVRAPQTRMSVHQMIVLLWLNMFKFIIYYSMLIFYFLKLLSNVLFFKALFIILSTLLNVLSPNIILLYFYYSIFWWCYAFFGAEKTKEMEKKLISCLLLHLTLCFFVPVMFWIYFSFDFLIVLQSVISHSLKVCICGLFDLKQNAFCRN